MTLIDRINLYFKLGTRIHLKFTDEERVFVRRAEQTITFDDVIKLAEDLLAYAKAKKEEENNQQSTTLDDMAGEEDADGYDDDFDADDAEESDESGDGEGGEEEDD